MSELEPQPGAAENSPPIIVEYNAPPDLANSPGSRPLWVYVVLTFYLILLACLASLPILASTQDRGLSIVASIFITVLFVAGVGLMVTPVYAIRGRPISRRSIWIPIVSAGLLVGGLFFGGGLALVELAKPLFDPVDQNGGNVGGALVWCVIGLACIAWIWWSIIFLLIARGQDSTSVGMRLHRLLIKGSALELVIAVPCHIVVRRRSECCAGYLTGTGICIGVAVALISFGPMVQLLYYRRMKQITVPENRQQGLT